MHPEFSDIIKQATGATEIRLIEGIQELWSGYGAILRYALTGSSITTVVVKHVRLAEGGDHPRGWNTDFSHRRKLQSYQVETAWYRDWSQRCGKGCRVPRVYAVESRGDETLMVMEDLDAAGFPVRKDSIGKKEITACLQWLAEFHATFLEVDPKGLWSQGTYWHLATRPDELVALDDLPLKKAASEIDRLLRESSWQTLVHGDAKLANFCFSEEGAGVAAVDFQYVGGGCGMKDVAYFIGSCLMEKDCEQLEDWLLETYFSAFRTALNRLQPQVDASAVETEWRQLFPVAWTDFHRFLKGWSPEHWKINDYSERLAREVLNQLS